MQMTQQAIPVIPVKDFPEVDLNSRDSVANMFSVIHDRYRELILEKQMEKEMDRASHTTAK